VGLRLSVGASKRPGIFLWGISCGSKIITHTQIGHKEQQKHSFPLSYLRRCDYLHP
jgi:hypothetical protein